MSKPNTSVNVNDVIHDDHYTAGVIPEMQPIVIAARTRNLSPYIVRKWCLNGTIKAVRCGNKIFVNCDTLDDYLNTHRLTDTVEDQSGGIRPIQVKIERSAR